MPVDSLVFATLNVRGLSARKKQYQLKRLLDSYPGIDVFAAQETKMGTEQGIEQMLSQYFMDQGRALLQLEAGNPGSYLEEISDIKLRLELLDHNRYEGARVRSRSKRFLAGEVPTKSSIAEERKHTGGRLITCLESEGKVVTDLEDIKAHFVQYYTSLFGTAAITANQGCIQAFLSEMPKLGEPDKEVLASPLTEEEISDAIASLNLNRSPGPDGLCAEFYKKFSAYLVPILLDVYAEAEENGIFSGSFRRSHTVLVPKKVAESSTAKVTDYRPITLCNVDYKIYAKVMVARLQLVLPQLIGDHQACGIRGRTILTNIHVVRTILDLCLYEGDHVAMLQLDLSKAFDRVCHTYLFALLEYVNVGARFVGRIKLCYEQVATSLIINNTLAAPIMLRSSVRQGCPLSPLLFDLYLEPLCRRVIRLNDIHGFELAGTVIKVAAYADDLAFLVKDKPSVVNVMEQVDLFGQASGARVNKDQSLGVWCGHWATTPGAFCGIPWQEQNPRYLGVPLQETRNPSRMLSQRLDNIRKHAFIWRKKDLSIFQRATVCNVFLAAKLVYLLQVLQCPRKVVHACHRIFATTIWCSTFERMRRDYLFRKLRDGGLGLQHLFVKQLVMRLWFIREELHPVFEGVKRILTYNYIPELHVTFTEGTVRLTGFFKEVVECMLFLKARFTLEYLLSVNKKTLAAHLIDTLFPVPVYRDIPPTWPGRDVLVRVQRMPIKPNMKTFFYKLHTSTLPVKAWLAQKGIYVPWSAHCRFCNVPETHDHLFLDCTEAQFFWDDLQYKVFKTRLRLNPHTIRFLPLHPRETVRRPYNVHHFGEALDGKVRKEDVANFGVYQYSHIWTISFHNGEAKDKLLALKEIEVKGRTCKIVDPNFKEVVVKVHWIPRCVPDEAVIRTFAAFGKVKEVTRQTWKTSFFEGVETTTREDEPDKEMYTEETDGDTAMETKLNEKEESNEAFVNVERQDKVDEARQNEEDDVAMNERELTTKRTAGRGN
ncbi:uncharacterized protein LOC135385841 [Ornithodoros turicata]|uniref:uncharacterized protein LOC135385841 n=1 Tax=Ornithodoros turicata TaxID=34597 RepID=UPI003138B795